MGIPSGLIARTLQAVCAGSPENSGNSQWWTGLTHATLGNRRGPRNNIRYEEVAMPVILWLFGFPVTLALMMWLVEIVRF